QRLLVVPDGVLHLLPWAALRSGGAYLVESRPVQVTSSATLYAQLTRRETPAERATVVGFGDPDYARRGAPAAGGARAAGNGSAAARALGRLRLQPLPATRGELEALRAVAPQGAQIWLGPEATEERAKAVDRRARIVHFAAHGFMDEALPLESGLALSIPAADADATENGILQAWEIFEGVRLDADLVTLSACQTALGKEVVGEGLLGLTWAFQYAGARRVLASLWEVSDASTAELMRGFYRHLSAGVPSDESLRRAQAGLLRRPATSAPYHWAAFTLIGGGH
ncbi:MAG TPA: CHAT domain-containing protein, partial [Vicinamibacteria bacterium]|nr:CHAT domain-containing protein [Vicinamibacteria bacterium]